MAAKIISWDPKQAKAELNKRLRGAKKARQSFEDQWRTNGNIVYNALSKNTAQFNITFDNVIELESGEVDEGDSEVGTNYAFKYLRFRHGQLSSNPPSVIARPSSPDSSDRQKADAADRIIRHGYEDGNIQELFDQAVLKTLTRGTGWIKQVWDPDKGDIVDMNEETQEVTLEGDLHCYAPDTFDVWCDPIARRWEDVRYIFERHLMPLEQAKYLWPEKFELLKKAVRKEKPQSYNDAYVEDVVEVFEYWEKSLPYNGNVGRHAWHLDDGTLLEPMTKNPHLHHRLPYYMMTDIDVEDVVYGKSTIEYVARKQELLNRFDSGLVDAMEAHGAVRLLVPESTEINDDEISNSNYDIIKYSGAVPPHHMAPAQLPPDLFRLRQQLRDDIQEMMGLNDAQLGIQKRETSGFSQQTMIESGNINNRRMFNKYTKFVKEFWRDRLGLIKEHWDIPRLILTLGQENAFEAAKIKGADIAGGFDIVVEYGASLPLDPNLRREQIMLLIEPLTQAGVPMKRVLKHLKLNELDNIYDELEQGERRQREIFEEMLALHKQGGDVYIEPKELEDHESMLVFAQKYTMSMEYKVLPEEVKVLIDQHIKDRMELAAQVATQGSAEQQQQQPQLQAAPPIPGTQ